MLVAMTIAGSDSSGGAGIEADIKAMASLGVHAAFALTAVTSQNTQRVASIFPIPPEVVVSQIDSVLEDVPVSAAKTGMLFSAPIAEAVAQRLSGEDIPLVVDPVLVAGVGDPLGRADLVDAIKERIVPLATILTPNVPEAEALVGRRIRNEDDVRRACRELGDIGAEAVLLKGGHLGDGECATCTDTLYFNGKFLQLEVPRLEVRGHGGGCILSSFLAANLAKGMGVWEAAVAAKIIINEAVRSNYPVGKGVPVVDPIGRVVRNAQRWDAADRLKRAAESYAGLVPAEWVPERGSKILYALPGAAVPGDVCSVDERIAYGARAGGVSFDTSPEDAAPVLTAMRFDEGVRASLDLPASERQEKALRKSGLSVVAADAVAKERESGLLSMEDVLRELRFVPDAVLIKSGPRSPAIYLLAQGPEELLAKLGRVLR